MSTNGGVSFTPTGKLSASTTTFKIVVNPNETGDVWVSSDKGLFHSIDLGASFAALCGITQAWGIGLGAPAIPGGYLAVFAVAELDGIVGYYRSDDSGLLWV